MNLVYCLAQGSCASILLVSMSIGCCGPVYFVKLYTKHYEWILLIGCLAGQQLLRYILNLCLPPQSKNVGWEIDHIFRTESIRPSSLTGLDSTWPTCSLLWTNFRGSQVKETFQEMLGLDDIMLVWVLCLYGEGDLNTFLSFFFLSFF